MITWNDFEKVEMRIGTILNVEDFPEARKPAYQIAETSLQHPAA